MRKILVAAAAMAALWAQAVVNEDPRFKVSAAGDDVAVFEARVSKNPINRIWPGKQRDVGQSEIAGWCQIFSSKAVDLEVRIERDFRDVLVRPLSKGVKPVRFGRTLRLTLPGPGQYSIETDGHHEPLVIFVNPKGELKPRRGNKVKRLGKGVHRLGRVELGSNETLYLEEGAVLEGSVFALNAENVEVIGYGVIDGSEIERTGVKGIGEEDPANPYVGHGGGSAVPYVEGRQLPEDREGFLAVLDDTESQDGGMRFYRSRGIRIEGVTVRDSALWAIALGNCEDVEIDNVKTIGQWRYNADGIDFCNCRKVRLSNSFLRNFDDGIVIKGIPGFDAWNNEDYVVENCVVWSDWGRSLEIGAETCAPEYKDITFRNCDVIHASAVALDIQHHNWAYIHDIRFEDIRCEFSKYHEAEVFQQNDDQQYANPNPAPQPLLVQIPMWDFWHFTKNLAHGSVRDVVFKDIKVLTDDFSVGAPKCDIRGLTPSNMVSNVVFDNFTIDGRPFAPEISTNEFTSGIVVKTREVEYPEFKVVVDFENKAAMDDFRYHMWKMGAFGATIEVAPHQYPVSDDTDEKFRLKVEGRKAWISGKSELAVNHGIYELLSRMGCDWVMPGRRGEVIPRREDPKIDDCDIEQAPSFIMRGPWYTGGFGVMTWTEWGEHDQWKYRKKLQGGWGTHHPLFMDGGHMWDQIIMKYKDVFDEHPEYLALVRQPDGTYKRSWPQVDTSNPDVVKLFERFIRETFEERGWPKDKAVCIGVGPADGAGFSESAEARSEASGRIDPMSGLEDQTDTLVLLCNRILDDIGEEFPNLLLGWYLYSVHADFPARYKPNPRISIIIADISYSRMHATGEAVPSRRFYQGIMDKWSETPNLKFFRGYNWNLAESFLPYSKLKIWEHDIPMYHAMNVQGVGNEEEVSWATMGPSNYYEADLLWNVKSDMRSSLAKYCRNAFGKGAKYMEDYYLRLTERQSAAREEAGSFFSFHLVYDRLFVDEAKRLFDRAYLAAKLPEEKERILYARFPLDQLGEYLEMRELQFGCRFAEANALLDSMIARREEIYGEHYHWVSHAAMRMLNYFFRSPLQEAVKYSTVPYKTLYNIPDELTTVFDPYGRGVEMGYADGDLNDANWLKTKTYTMPWAAQGISSLINCSVWYRIRLPKMPDGPVGLLVGGCDSIARVFVNGGYVGEGHGYTQPFAFDLTDFIRPGEGNFLAIEIRRNGLSELGTGGILYPSFVFTGPRLEQRAPTIDDSIRLLPGGAIAPAN